MVNYQEYRREMRVRGYRLWLRHRINVAIEYCAQVAVTSTVIVFFLYAFMIVLPG